MYAEYDDTADYSDGTLHSLIQHDPLDMGDNANRGHDILVGTD